MNTNAVDMNGQRLLSELDVIGGRISQRVKYVKLCIYSELK